MNEKKGLARILDSIEALRVRLVSSRDEHRTPPTTVLDERLVDRFGHWEQLCKEALTEAKTMQDAWDRITARLALPADTAPTDVADAVTAAVRRLQELEQKVIDFQDAHTQELKPQVTLKAVSHDALSESQAVNRGDEPRASWVLERMEGLTLGGWLRDAAEKLDRVADYMRDNESRMSEDLFDELGRIAERVGGWASSFLRGDLFPRTH